MDLGIRGKRALVCASSKGLGRGCAEALAAAGVDLVLNARGAEALEATPKAELPALIAGWLDTLDAGGQPTNDPAVIFADPPYGAGWLVELEVADEDGLAYAQFRNVHDDFVGKVLDQCADDQFAGRQGQLTADLHALGVAGQAYRNGD